MKKHQQVAVFDTETTGMEEQDQVVEVAVVLGTWNGRKLSLDSTFTSLVRPTVPIHPAARANHHLTDAELAEAPPLAKVLRRLPDLTGRFVVAHNLEFDAKMLAQSGLQHWTEGLPGVDTVRCARHLWPDAPAYQNQVLRYYLELAVPAPWCDEPPHRALPDAVVTFGLLERMLREVGEGGMQKLASLTTQPAVLKTCHFGQNRGKAWRDLDSGFLRWVLNKDFGDDVKHTCRTLLAEREGRNAIPAQAKRIA